MKKGLMLIVLVAGLCGITKAQAQVEEVIIEQRLPDTKSTLKSTHSGITGCFCKFWSECFLCRTFLTGKI